MSKEIDAPWTPEEEQAMREIIDALCDPVKGRPDFDVEGFRAEMWRQRDCFRQCLTVSEKPTAQKASVPEEETFSAKRYQC